MAAAQQLIRGNIHCADDRDQYRARKAELVALLDDPDTANDLIAQSWRAHSLVHVLTEAPTSSPSRVGLDPDAGTRQQGEMA